MGVVPPLLLLALLVGCSGEPVAVVELERAAANCLDDPDCMDSIKATITETTTCPGEDGCTDIVTVGSSSGSVAWMPVPDGLTLDEETNAVEIDCDTIHAAIAEKCGE